MPTIQDVANHAGVSIATVSRVLNGSATVNATTAERVRLAIQLLQYRPSRAARTLRASRSTIIGLLISDIQNPFCTTLVRGVEDVAQRHGYSIILCNSDEEPHKERRYVEVLCAEQVAGAIVMPTRERQPALRLFGAQNIPIVAVDRRVHERETDAVLVDNVGGARAAVAHLIEQGYRRIGLIAGPQNMTTGHERAIGYRLALQEAGLPHDSVLERHGALKEEMGWRFAAELLDLPQPIDALFVGNNLAALGALEALRARNLCVPDDVGVVGYDEIPGSALSAVALSTVIQPVYDLGATAALRLFQRMHTREALARQEIVLAPHLLVRSSSCPRLSQAQPG